MMCHRGFYYGVPMSKEIKIYSKDKEKSIPVSSFDSYLDRINSIPMLTAEEEIELAERLQKHGDLDAAQRLVTSHLRYVVRVAKGYMGYGLMLPDLVQEGTIGLMKAVKRFQPERGVRLVSFAVHWIKSEIHEYIIKNWKIVKVATTKAQRKLFFNLRSSKKHLGWFTKEEVDAVALDLNVKPEEVLRMEQRLNMKDVSFDMPSSEDQQEHKYLLSPEEYLESSDQDPERIHEKINWDENTKQTFKFAFAQLDERSQEIINKRWLAEEKATLQDLAITYDVSPERIRQLENNAFKKLQKLMGAQ